MRKLAIAMTCAAIALFLFPVATLAGLGVDPGKVYIDNLYPGTKAEVQVTVTNQNDHEITLIAAARQPDYTTAGYEPLPYRGWVTCNPAEVAIPAGGKTKITVTIAMPQGAAYEGKQAEAWIGFVEKGSTSTAQIGVTRLLISMRGSGASGVGAMPGDTGGVSISAVPASQRASPTTWAVLAGAIALSSGAGAFWLLRKKPRKRQKPTG